jgi:hypothetical protein
LELESVKISTVLAQTQNITKPRGVTIPEVHFHPTTFTRGTVQRTTGKGKKIPLGAPYDESPVPNLVEMTDTNTAGLETRGAIVGIEEDTSVQTVEGLIPGQQNDVYERIPPGEIKTMGVVDIKDDDDDVAPSARVDAASAIDGNTNKSSRPRRPIFKPAKYNYAVSINPGGKWGRNKFRRYYTFLRRRGVNGFSLPVTDEWTGPSVSSGQEDKLEDIRTVKWANMSIKQSMRTYGTEETMESLKLEIDALIKNDTFQVIPVNSMTKSDWASVVNTFANVTEKFKSDGTRDKLKSRLLANGKEQKEETGLFAKPNSSPTVRSEHLMAMLNIAVHEKRVIKVLDVKNAFTHAPINADVFLRLPADVADLMMAHDPAYGNVKQSNGSIVVKLKKALYGLRQSPMLWHLHLSNTLIQAGFVRSKYDACIFTKNVGSTKQVLAVLSMLMIS